MKQSSKELLERLLNETPELEPARDNLAKGIDAIISCFRADGKMLVCGNGGSASDALHIVGELMKSFVLPRRPLPEEETKLRKSAAGDAEYILNNLQRALPTISLVSETALITAYSNDAAPELAFAQQVYGYGRPGDVLLALSTSGNSKNVLYACQVAQAFGLTVVALTGETGGVIKTAADILVTVPGTDAFRVQNLQMPLYHMLCLVVEHEFFGE